MTLTHRDVALVVLVAGCTSDPDGDGLVQDAAPSQDAASDLGVVSPVDAAGSQDTALVPDAAIVEGPDSSPDAATDPPDVGPPGLPECAEREFLSGYACINDVLEPESLVQTEGPGPIDFEVVQVRGPGAEPCEVRYGFLSQDAHDGLVPDPDAWMLELVDTEGRAHVLGFALPGQAALLDRAPFEVGQQLVVAAREYDGGEGGSKSSLLSISRDGQPVLFASNRNLLPPGLEAVSRPVCYDTRYERVGLEVELSAGGEQVTLQMGETARIGGWILTLAEAYDYPEGQNFDVDLRLIWGVRE